MELHITEVKPPREGKKAYIVKASNGVDYFCSKGGGALRPDTTITAEVTVQEYSGKTYNWIKSYTPSNDVEKIKQVFPDSKVVSNSNGYSQLQTTAKDLQSLLPNNQYMIVLQTILKTGTKPEDWDLALRWYFDNLKAGVLETDKRLNGGQEVL